MLQIRETGDLVILYDTKTKTSHARFGVFFHWNLAITILPRCRLIRSRSESRPRLHRSTWVCSSPAWM